MKKKYALTDKLKEKIKKEIKASATSRHVPSKIIEINEVPITISGKKVEIAVTRIINGEKIFNKDALANPKSLGQFVDMIELKN